MNLIDALQKLLKSFAASTVLIAISKYTIVQVRFIDDVALYGWGHWAIALFTIYMQIYGNSRIRELHSVF